jgi:diguanylate cyclase (GGDEF)-like protein
MPLVTEYSPLLLAIDDDPITRMMLEKVLVRAGYRVVTASSGAAGIALCEAQHPDLVLLDVMMPEMDGFQTCNALRDTTSGEHIPVIMLTGLEDPESIEAAFNAGATDFVTKPINWGLLSQRVKFALRAYDMEQGLRKAQSHLAYAQRLAQLGYWEWQFDTDIVSGSAEMFTLFGHKQNKPMPRALFLAYLTNSSKSTLEQALMTLEQGADTLSIVIHIEKATGEAVLNILGEAQRNEQGTLISLSGSVQDITRISKAEATITRLNLHDSLTDLPNRNFFMEMLIQGLQKHTSKGSKAQLAVLTLDIDRFKLFNQSLGIQGGDDLLKALAERLAQITREGDIIARLGSDEFVVLLDMTAEDHIEAIAGRYHNSILKAFTIHGEEVFITPSLGIAIAPLDSDQAEPLLACANTAKTRAKHAGGNQYQFYTASMNQQAAKRLKLEHDLRRAVELGQMRVYYQPKIASDDLRLVGAEALVRWQHPEWGLVRPDEFISIAEETGMILEIGKWVLDEACQKAVAWRQRIADFHIGVNLSARQFLQDDLLQQVEASLRNSKLPAAALDLEITESLAMADAQHNIEILRELKQLGIHLSIDDFGTGYSSLSYLQAFPVDTIKIDRSFIMRIGTPEGGKADEGIAAAIIAMAHSLDLSLVAEGIENEAQAAFLTRQGCEVFQGFYFGRPVPHDAFEAQFPILTQSDTHHDN